MTMPRPKGKALKIAEKVIPGFNRATLSPNGGSRPRSRMRDYTRESESNISMENKRFKKIAG